MGFLFGGQVFVKVENGVAFSLDVGPRVYAHSVFAYFPRRSAEEASRTRPLKRFQNTGKQPPYSV